MTERMPAGDRRLLGVFSFLALAGFGLVVPCPGGLLEVGIHTYAVGASFDGLSSLAHAFGDLSPVPGVLSLLLLFAVLVLILSDLCLFRNGPHSGLLHYIPLSTALCFLALLILMVILLRTDLCYIPYQYPDLGYPYVRMVAYAIIVLGVCAASLLYFHFTRRSFAAYFFAFFPLVPCMFVVHSRAALYLQATYPRGLAILFPRTSYVYMGVAVFLVVFLLLWRVARRRGKTVLHMLLVAAGMWSCAMFFFVSLGTLSEFRCMCDITSPTIQQWQSALCALLIKWFAALYVSIVIFQLSRWLWIRRKGGDIAARNAFKTTE